MATTVAGGTPTCVSWLLLASFAVLLAIGGFGLSMTIDNYLHEEEQPPTPPPENTTTVNTTTHDSSRYYYEDRHRVEVPQAYKDYVSQSAAFANISNDTKFYLAPLCLVGIVVAALPLVAGLLSRRLFSSTFSLYSCLCLWILTLVMTIIYQNNLAWSGFHFDQYMSALTLGCHILLLLFLPIQMLLCMWELRRQKTEGWPTINFLNLFSIEALLLASRLTLVVFTFMVLDDSQIFRGFYGKQDPRYSDSYYSAPRIRYPLNLSLLCFSAASYNALATLETTLSMLLGKLHHRMTTMTCLLSGVCCVTVAVLSSPAFIRVFIGPFTMYPETMNFAIGLSVVTLSHWLACLCIPSRLRTPPRIITQLKESLLEVTSLGDIADVIRTQGMRGMELLPKKMKHDVHIKAASLIFSLVSLPIIGVSMGDTPSSSDWGHALVLCVNAVTVMRTLPPLVMEHLQEEREIIPTKQRLIGLAIETSVLMFGAFVVCVTGYGALPVIGGVMNIIFAVFQGVVMWLLFKGKLSQGQHTEDTRALTSSEEVASEEDNQNNLTEAMA